MGHGEDSRHTWRNESTVWHNAGGIETHGGQPAAASEWAGGGKAKKMEYDWWWGQGGLYSEIAFGRATAPGRPHMPSNRFVTAGTCPSLALY